MHCTCGIPRVLAFSQCLSCWYPDAEISCAAIRCYLRSLSCFASVTALRFAWEVHHLWQKRVVRMHVINLLVHACKVTLISLHWNILYMHAHESRSLTSLLCATYIVILGFSLLIASNPDRGYIIVWFDHKMTAAFLLSTARAYTCFDCDYICNTF